MPTVWPIYYKNSFLKLRFLLSPKAGCSAERGTALWGLHFQPSLPELWHCTTQMGFCAERSKFGNCHVQSVVKLLTEGLHQGEGKGWTSKQKPKWIKKQLLQYWTQEYLENAGKPKSSLFSLKCSLKTFQNYKILSKTSDEKDKKLANYVKLP